MAYKIDRLKFRLYPLITEDSACAAAAKRVSEARSALTSTLQELERAIRATDRFKAIEALANNSSDISFDFDNMKIQLWSGPYDRWGVEFSEPPVATHLDPKTLNALLTGKLLSPEEKRALLKSQGVDLEALSKAQPTNPTAQGDEQ